MGAAGFGLTSATRYQERKINYLISFHAKFVTIKTDDGTRRMNCFVIMPFAKEFDDVYHAIKTTVESSIKVPDGRCFRLDESRPAGRITDRLVSELRSATMCIADLTESKPNVMWELGFAMALGKPTIIITQNHGVLPFDIHDMQSIAYMRDQLTSTLVHPLRQSVLDTVATLGSSTDNAADATAKTIGVMREEMSQLKHMVAEAVRLWSHELPQQSSPLSQLQPLTGHWVNTESGSHTYSRVIRGELVSPYCYGGNEQLTGVYYGWRRTGEYWYARFQWFSGGISGFSFLRMDSLENLSGAWWYSEDGHGDDTRPPGNGGIPASWVKISSETPAWAEQFFDDVEQRGLAAMLVGE